MKAKLAFINAKNARIASAAAKYVDDAKAEAQFKAEIRIELGGSCDLDSREERLFVCEDVTDSEVRIVWGELVKLGYAALDQVKVPDWNEAVCHLRHIQSRVEKSLGEQ